MSVSTARVVPKQRAATLREPTRVPVTQVMRVMASTVMTLTNVWRVTLLVEIIPPVKMHQEHTTAFVTPAILMMAQELARPIKTVMRDAMCSVKERPMMIGSVKHVPRVHFQPH